MKLKITFIFWLSCLVLPLFSAQALSGTEHQSVHVIPVDTEVEYGLTGFIKRGINDAKEAGAGAIVLDIDTFGGRVDAALAIINEIEKAGEIPVIAYISDKAWSAGALIALGCKQIYMKPGSSIGSATPVASGGPAKQAQPVSEKYVSAIRAKFRSVAEKNGYSPNLSAAMVDKDLEVREVTVGQKTMYLTPDEIEQMKKENKAFTEGRIIIGKDKLLNLTAKQAVDVGMAKKEAATINALLTEFELGNARVVDHKRNWAEHFASFATSATVSGLLLMIGLMALYTELSHPGFGWAGVIGIACLGLLFWGKYIVNLAEMTELLLFSIGVLLLLVEIFVIPGFGITGIAGLAFIGAGLYLAFVPFVVPKAPWDFALFFRTMTIMTVALLASITGFLILVHFLPELPGMKRLVLTTSLNSGAGTSVPVAAGRHDLIGKTGEAVTDLRPVGKARIDGQLMDVVAETGLLRKGSSVEVVAVDGNRYMVKEKQV